MTYVLIILMLGNYGRAIDHIEFGDKVACKRAQSELLIDNQNSETPASLVTLCVNRIE